MPFFAFFRSNAFALAAVALVGLWRVCTTGFWWGVSHTTGVVEIGGEGGFLRSPLPRLSRPVGEHPTPSFRSLRSQGHCFETHEVLFFLLGGYWVSARSMFRSTLSLSLCSLLSSLSHFPFQSSCHVSPACNIFSSSRRLLFHLLGFSSARLFRT